MQYLITQLQISLGISSPLLRKHAVKFWYNECVYVYRELKAWAVSSDGRLLAA